MIEKILEDIIKKVFCVEIRECEGATVILLDDVEEIIQKHLSNVDNINDGLVPAIFDNEKVIKEIKSIALAECCASVL